MPVSTEIRNGDLLLNKINCYLNWIAYGFIPWAIIFGELKSPSLLSAN